ncbi:MAG: magnesium/cobalt transporter CorA [Chloroflexi bacterium]|nr:magnesium/cobalt transporter CorA [Chloroflexota bacterium]
MSYKAYYVGPDGELKVGLEEEGIRQVFEAREGLLWVDVSGTTAEDGHFLARVFHFHPLAIEDCVGPRIHSPKLDDFADYLFIVVHGVNYEARSEVVETAELCIFLGPNFVVSTHRAPLLSIDQVGRLVELDGRPMRRGTAFLGHALMDGLVDSVLPTIDRMSEVGEQIEEEVVFSPRQPTLEAILRLKRSSLHIHRVMAPQREIVNRLSRGDFPLVKGEAQMFYRDVYDHIIRIEDLNQSLRDMAESALATYLSSVANRQNETMKLLSMVAAIFLPLTLLAGIYGMNFENMPELKWTWGYFAVLGFMGAVILGLTTWFWARRWITWGRGGLPRAGLFAVDREQLMASMEDLARWPHR